MLQQAFREKCVYSNLRGIPTDRKKPRCVLVFGPPGAGKDHVLELLHKHDHAYIGLDACMACLPRYWNGVVEHLGQEEVEDWVYALRPAARAIAEHMLEVTITRRAHFVWNGTGRNAQYYLRLAKRVKAIGYTVEIVGVSVQPSTALRRMRERERKNRRPVPRSVLEDALVKIPSSWEEVLPLADHARIWSNEDGPSPRLIFDAHQGVLDPKALETWRRPGLLLLLPEIKGRGRVTSD